MDTQPKNNQLISKAFLSILHRPLPTISYIKKHYKDRYNVPLKGFIQAANDRLLVPTTVLQMEERDMIKRCGMSIHLFNKIVNNNTHFTVYELQRIAEELGYEVEFRFKKIKSPEEETENIDE